MKTEVNKLAIAGVFALYAGAIPAHAVELVVHTASPQFFSVNSSLIMGEKDVIVVDAQYAKSEALKVAAKILESGKSLSHIVITHAHPDHFFGARTLKDIFPQAKVVASEDVAAVYPEVAKAKAAKQGEKLGGNFPGEPVEIDMTASSLSLDGETIEFMAGLSGDTSPITGVYIPSLNAFIAGDIVFEGMHSWTADSNADSRDAWVKQLEALQGKGYETVVAGHTATSDHSPDAIAATAKYVQSFSETVAAKDGSEAVIAEMNKMYPDLKADMILGFGAKVAEGEMEWH